MGKVSFSFWLDDKKNDDVIAWLNSHHNRSAIIRSAVIAAYQAATSPQGPTIDLTAIRRVVEAALDTKLAGLSLAAVTPNSDAPEGEDPKLAALLDTMFPDDM